MALLLLANSKLWNLDSDSFRNLLNRYNNLRNYFKCSYPYWGNTNQQVMQSPLFYWIVKDGNLVSIIEGRTTYLIWWTRISFLTWASIIKIIQEILPWLSIDFTYPRLSVDKADREPRNVRSDSFGKLLNRHHNLRNYFKHDRSYLFWGNIDSTFGLLNYEVSTIFFFFSTESCTLLWVVLKRFLPLLSLDFRIP